MSGPEARGGPDAGASLVELLVVVLLMIALARATWGVLAGQLGATARAADASERLGVARLGRHVLVEERRAGRPGRDWLPPADDTISLRAFRGVALPCVSGDPLPSVRVRYRGLRRADPDKDSLLVLGPDGRWRVRPLQEARADPDGDEACRGGGGDWRVELWTLPDPPAGFVAARLFERGSYHLADGALRYRRGLGGRQPLTPEILEDGASRLEPADGRGTIRLFLGFGCRRAPCGPAWLATLRTGVP